MHEFAIVQSLIEVACREVEARGIKRVISLKASVGSLRHVEPQNLEFLYHHCTKGTLLEGSELIVESQGVTVRCQHCGRTFEVVGGSFVCPQCGVADVNVLSGDEHILEEMEVEI